MVRYKVKYNRDVVLMAVQHGEIVKKRGGYDVWVLGGVGSFRYVGAFPDVHTANQEGHEAAEAMNEQ